MSILSIKNVSKSYPEQPPAVNDVSFDLDTGQIVSIIGLSGSGKTTLIKMIAGLIQPDSGEILFHGNHLEGPEEKLVPGHKEIRLVHQDFKLHHRMTVRENMKNALLDYIAEYRKERTEELLALTKITQIGDQYVHEISGGEKQRLAIAMALATEPEVLLFDEPFSNLDLVTKSILLQEIEEIAHQTETSVILITHDSRDAMEIADHLIVLHDGQILKSGSPNAVYENPEKSIVANLIGIYNELNTTSQKKLDIQSKSSLLGLWAEDITIGTGPYSGTIQKIISTGPFHKIRIEYHGLKLWGFDFEKVFAQSDTIQFGIHQDRLFTLGKA